MNYSMRFFSAAWEMEPALKIEIWKLLSGNFMMVDSFAILMKNKILLVHTST